MQTPVEQCRKLLRCVFGGQIRPADIAHKQRVPGKDGARLRRLVQVGQHRADALNGVSRSLEKIEAAVTELQGVSISHRNMRKGRASRRSHVDARACAFRKLVVAGDEIRMQMGLNDVLDL